MKKITLLVLLAFSFLGTQKAFSQEGYIGDIKMFAGNFEPRNWAFCDGRLLSIAQNTALFSILGTTYGGNGQTTFALPDLRGRAPIAAGSGSGLSNYVIGQMSGTETNTLTINEIPSHNHLINAVSDNGNQNNPSGNLPADTGSTDKEYSDQAANTTMSSTMIAITGSGLPINNMQPYTTVNYVICLYGIFPSRND